jgi:AcrR family transcriptional regulator
MPRPINGVHRPRRGEPRHDSNRIARAAGYSPGTFYKHFPHKKEIFLAAYERWVTSEWTALQDSVGDATAIPVRELVQIVLENHRRWSTFRQSLAALAATDADVHRFRTTQREAQLPLVADLVARNAGYRPPPAHCLVLLLAFERVCDAIADGEVALLGLSEASVVEELQILFRSHLDSAH